MRVLIIFVFIISLTKKAESAYQWGFGDISINSLDWSSELEERDSKRDFTYLEIEGGAQFDWGDLYGFFDLEQPDRKGSEQRTASKAQIHYYLGKTPFSIYAHQFSFHSKGFSEQSRITGLGYRYLSSKFFFKPFIAYHSVVTTFYSGHNGYMAGWFAMYMFKAFKQNFRLVNWHENEFERARQYASGNGNETSSLNGAASIWWDATTKVNYGLQYRYAQDKLGSDGFFHAYIFSLRFNL